MKIPLVLFFITVNCFASNGVKHTHDEIIITYKIGTSIEDQKILEEKYSLQSIRKFRLTNSVFYKILSNEEPFVLKNEIKKYDFVKIVSLNKALTPNSLSLDSGFPNQWYLENTGQEILFESGVADIDIGWKKAMEIYNKKQNSYVAVLDSGFAKDHDEIKDKNVINIDEFYGEFGKDDDSNGYVDDTYGWDFYDNDSDPYDFHGHGTQISSIISGANDGVGMQGISQDTFIFPMRVAGQWLDGITRPTVASVLEALNYIYYNPGIRVINLSISLSEDELLAMTIDQFDRDDKVLLICSAGNDGKNIDLKSRIPASLNSNCIISVASVNSTGNLSFFSNYGKRSVDLGAPGEKIYVATIKEVIQKYYPIDSTSWIQAFNWSESPLSWVRGELYQESYFYKSATFVTPFTAIPYVTELTNLVDPIDLSNSIMPTLKLKLMYNIQPPSFAYLFASSKALGPYSQEYSFNGSTNFEFENYPIKFDQFKGSEEVYIKFVIGHSNPQDFFAFGTTSYWDLDVDNYTGEPYYSYVNGTSFSAPIVSAVASMLFSHRPDLLASDVKKIILDSVRPLSSLSNKTLSGGIVRADKALIEANKYPKRVKIELGATSWFEDLIVKSSGVVAENNEYGTSDVGKVLGAGWYFKGDVVTIDATANAGWEFGGWSHREYAGGSKQTFTLNDNLSLDGIFLPNLSDEDNDKLEYYFEIDWGTDPDNADSDGDSINDGDEVSAFFISDELDPLINNSDVIEKLKLIFGKDSFLLGQQSVINDASAFSLVRYDEFTKAIAEAKASAKAEGISEGKEIGNSEGKHSVIANPSAYNLFTSEQYEEALQSLDTNATPYTPSWFYMPKFGWMWTSKKAFPWFHDANSNNWMYFKSGYDSPRFYHYGTKEWMTLE